MNQQSIPLPVPADNELFTLEVDNDRDPMEVVTAVGYDKNGWEYLGPKRMGKSVYTDVRLVRFGHVRNLKEARRAANKLGYRLLEGQAREAFKAKYPVPAGHGSIVFGGAEWRYPNGYADVPSLSEGDKIWKSRFYFSDREFLEPSCRWAVVEKEKLTEPNPA